jgi:hypothetical protein
MARGPSVAAAASIRPRSRLQMATVAPASISAAALA